MLGAKFGFMRKADAGLPLFDVDFQAGDTLPAGGVFSRASIAMTRDHEDIYRECLDGELRFKGLRRIQNLFTASGTPATQTITLVVDARYAFYFRDGSGTGSYALTGAATATVAEGEGFTFTATTTSLLATLSGTPGASATVQLEETSGAAVNAPGEYVDIDTVANAEKAGVEYFTTENGNTFTAPGPGAVTEATGSTIAAATREGVLLDPATTNVNIRSFDLSLWSGVSGGTAALDAVGIDGRANKASTLTDNSNNLEAMTIAPTLGATGKTTMSVWFEKDTSDPGILRAMFKSGYGISNFALQIDTFTGSTAFEFGSADASGSIDAGDWWILWATFTATSTSGSMNVYPAHGTVLGTVDVTAQGTAIVGHVQVEAGEVVTSPVVTNGSTATRAVDALTMPTAKAAPWTLFQDCVPQTDIDLDGAVMGYVSGSDIMSIDRDAAATAWDGNLADVTNSAAAVVLDSGSGYSPGDQAKVALTSDGGDDLIMAANGTSDTATPAAGVIDTSGFATAGIGMPQTGGPAFPISVRKAQFFGSSKSAAALQTLTTI